MRSSRSDGTYTDDLTWATAGGLPLLLDDGAKSYIYGPSSAPIAEIVDGSTVVHYLHADLIGSTRVITDHTSAVVGTTRFDEYGNRTGHAGFADSAIGYSGNLTDQVTGLVYLRARDYDPATAQFMSVDRAVDSTHQPYAYVANNPLMLTDPTGLDFWGDVGSNAAAFGLGVLDGATFGVSSMILGAVVPGYNCFTEGNGWFTAGSIVGTVVSTVAVTALTAGAGSGLAIAGIAGRLAIKEAVKLGISEARRLVASGVEKVVAAAAKRGSAEAEAAAGASFRGAGAGANSVFWSGGRSAQGAADKWALENGGTTLGMTPAGRAVESATQDMAWSDAKPLWEEASAKFAQNATGTAHVFQSAAGVSLNSVWRWQEYGALVENGVNLVFHTVW